MTSFYVRSKKQKQKQITKITKTKVRDTGVDKPDEDSSVTELKNKQTNSNNNPERSF